jgi:hypothetical protein
VVGIYVAWIQETCIILLVLITPALVGVMLKMENWDMALVVKSMYF